jgi:hypothetical protein
LEDDMTKKVWFRPQDEDRLDADTWQRSLDYFCDKLLPHRVQVPRFWRRCVSPDHYYPRDCFPRALYYLHETRLPQALYVYGEASCGGLNQHAWVQIDGVVFDGVLQEFYDAQGYMAVNHAKRWYLYTRDAAMWIDRMNRKHHPELWSYGFHHLLGLGWADFANPELIDLANAKAYWKRVQQGERQ